MKQNAKKEKNSQRKRSHTSGAGKKKLFTNNQRLTLNDGYSNNN